VAARDTTTEPAVPSVARPRRVRELLGTALRPVRTTVGGLIGGGLVLAFVLIVVFGPLLAKYAPDASAGDPFARPSGAHPLGTDFLGRDVVSRWLYGGRSAIGLAAAATTLGAILGLTTGLVAAYRSDWIDGLTMRLGDIVLAFPPLLLFLLILATVGNSIPLIIVVVAAYHALRMARMARAATREVMVLPFVEAAQARGDSATHILCREVLPNIWTPILIEASFRFIYSVIIIAALSFLGLGLQPPTADWGLMISENRQGLEQNAWATLAPTFSLALLAVGVNLLAETYAQAAGRNVDAYVTEGGPGR
jgi:peptide/nickel transport system permease protein